MAETVKIVAGFALATTKYVASVATPVVVAIATATVAFTSYAPTVAQEVGFPYVVNTATGTTSAANTTTFTPLATGAPISGTAPGDMLVAVFSNDGSTVPQVDTTYSGSNWVVAADSAYSSTVRGTVFYKIAGASNALRLTTAAAEQGSWIIAVVRGAGAISVASSNGSSTNSNPPNLAPVGGTKKYLWLATRTGDSTVIPTVAPTNFGGLQSIAASGTGGASTSISNYALEASSIDPGAFTVANEQWVCFTIALWADSANALPPTGSIASTTYAPTVGVSLSANVTPPVGSIGFTSYSPQTVNGIETSIKVTGFSVGFTGYPPSVPAPTTSGVSIPHAYIAANQPHVTIDWVPPVQNIDGSQITNLAGYKVYYGQSVGVYGTPVTVADPLATYTVLRLPTSGTWYFQVTAYNALAEESDLGSVIATPVPSLAFAPDAHNGLTQIGGGNFTLATPAVSGAGVLRHNGTGAMLPPLSTVTASGVRRVTGTGAMSPVVGIVVGYGLTSGVGSPNWFARYTSYTFGGNTLQANTWAPRNFVAIQRAQDGDGVLVVSPASVSGLGRRGISDLGSPVEIEVPEVEIAASGGSGLKFSGSGVLSASAATTSGAGKRGSVGAGAISPPNVTLTVVGDRGLTTTSALTAPTVVFYGQGNVNGVTPTPTISGSGAFSSAAFTITGAGFKNKVGATIRGNGVLLYDRPPFVESFADLIPRLNLTVNASLVAPGVYLDGEGESHLTITGTGALAPRGVAIAGDGFTPSTISGLANLVAPEFVLRARGWGPATTPEETWTIRSSNGKTWTAVITQSEEWNG